MSLETREECIICKEDIIKEDVKPCDNCRVLNLHCYTEWLGKTGSIIPCRREIVCPSCKSSDSIREITEYKPSQETQSGCRNDVKLRVGIVVASLCLALATSAYFALRYLGTI